MRKLIIIMFAGILAGCAPNAAKIAAAHHAQCVELGFVEGTTEYGNCRLTLQQVRAQEKAARASAFMGSISAGQAVRQSYHGY